MNQPTTSTTTARSTTVTKFRITDTITGTDVTVDPAGVAEALADWYPDGPADVAAAVVDLEALILAGEYTGEVEAFLGVWVERVS